MALRLGEFGGCERLEHIVSVLLLGLEVGKEEFVRLSAAGRATGCECCRGQCYFTALVLAARLLVPAQKSTLQLARV